MLQTEDSGKTNLRRPAEGGDPLAAPEPQTMPALVTLRNHPSMLYRGARNWPPIWTQAGRHGAKTARGELGVLTKVSGDQRSTQRFYLAIEYEGERYIGTLLFDDPVFGWLISKVLRSHLGWPIQEIGSLDLGFTVLRKQSVETREAVERSV